MPRGIYVRKPRDPNAAPKADAPKPRKAKAEAPPVAKAGWKASALAELMKKRAQIDAAIEAINALA